MLEYSIKERKKGVKFTPRQICEKVGSQTIRVDNYATNTFIYFCQLYNEYRVTDLVI